MSGARGPKTLGIAAALIAAGVWARCTNLLSVFGGPETELLPADSHYYVRFARMQLAHLGKWPPFDSFDPLVNFPTGAAVYWPPLHTWLLSALVGLAPESGAESAVALAGPIWSALLLLLSGAVLMRWLGATPGLLALAVLALTPIAVESGALGNADHHVHEPYVVALAVVFLGRALATGDRHSALLAGVAIGAARLLTPLGFVLVPIAAGAVGAAALLAPREARGRIAGAALACGGAAALLFALSALLFGSLGTISYESLSLFHPLLAVALLCGPGAAAGLAAGRRNAWLPLLAALGSTAAILPALARALGHLGHGDPILSMVVESQPLARDPAWALKLFGPLLLAAPLALLYLAREVLARRALEHLPVLSAAALLAAAAAMQARFSQALVGALAVAIGVVAPRAWELLRERRALAFAAAALTAAPALPQLLLKPWEPPPEEVTHARPTLRWMRDHLPERAAVVAGHHFGHFILLWAERPAVASLFGQAEVHREGNRRAAAVLSARDEEEGYGAMRATSARYLLATPVGRLPEFPERKRAGWLVSRLSKSAGMESEAGPASARFRLLYDSAELRDDGSPYVRLFEAVEGAVLAGVATPGAEVTAELALQTNRGEALRYLRRTVAGEDGRYRLRVAYPTGADAPVRASGAAYAVRSGPATAEVTVSPEQLHSGAQVAVPPLTPSAEAKAP